MPSCSRLCPQASNRLNQLNYFEGGHNLVPLLPSPSPVNNAWTKGVNAAGGSMRALRILMPVGMAVDILENADISVFEGQGGAVECEPEALKHPNWAVYFLKDQNCHTMVVSDLWDKVHCKTLELPLKFHQEMVRYQFRIPPKGQDMSRDEWLAKCNR